MVFSCKTYSNNVCFNCNFEKTFLQCWHLWCGLFLQQSDLWILVLSMYSSFASLWSDFSISTDVSEQWSICPHAHNAHIHGAGWMRDCVSVLMCVNKEKILSSESSSFTHNDQTCSHSLFIYLCMGCSKCVCPIMYKNSMSVYYILYSNIWYYF